MDPVKDYIQRLQYNKKAGVQCTHPSHGLPYRVEIIHTVSSNS